MYEFISSRTWVFFLCIQLVPPMGVPKDRKSKQPLGAEFLDFLSWVKGRGPLRVWAAPTKGKRPKISKT